MFLFDDIPTIQERFVVNLKEFLENYQDTIKTRIELTQQALYCYFDENEKEIITQSALDQLNDLTRSMCTYSADYLTDMHEVVVTDVKSTETETALKSGLYKDQYVLYKDFPKFFNEVLLKQLDTAVTYLCIGRKRLKEIENGKVYA